MENSLPNISSNVVCILLELYGGNENDLMKTISTSPKTSVIRVNLCHREADNAKHILEDYLKKCSPGRRFDVSSHPLLDDVLLVNSVDNDSVQQCYDKEVIVDTNCGSALLRGADIFAPGVLAASPAMQRGDTVSVYVDLEKKCRRGFVKHFEGRKYFVGNGVALYSRNELFEQNSKLSGTAIEMTQCRSHHPSFTQLDLAMFFPQNLPSILVGHILKPHQDEFVLDMCASPGGKTTHVATLMRNKGCVISIDKTQKKVDRIVTNCSNLGLTNVKTFCYDSTKLFCENNEQDSFTSVLASSPPYPAESFDKILLDPPCSGLGQRPQLHYVMKDKEIQSYPVYQRKLLKQAISLLKLGGSLVYSTCTLLPQENEQQVAWVLKNYPEMELDEQTPFYFGRRGLPNYDISSSDCEKIQRFDWCYVSNKGYRDNENKTEMAEPELTYHYDTIGFFIAKFIKVKT